MAGRSLLFRGFRLGERAVKSSYHYGKNKQLPLMKAALAAVDYGYGLLDGITILGCEYLAGIEGRHGAL